MDIMETKADYKIVFDRLELEDFMNPMVNMEISHEYLSLTVLFIIGASFIGVDIDNV